ncbi:MAG: hypothetical protein M1816_007279 [Peltula sp. TS41687]|nr:MAG: hypothetical protein M1816_007279 [Peltula sp. TS41687]
MILLSVIFSFLLGFQLQVYAYTHDNAAPGVLVGVDPILRRHRLSGNLIARVQADADRYLNDLQRRQAPATSPSAPAPSTRGSTGGNSTTKLQSWDAQTAAACEKAVKALNGVTLSESGIAVCYNLPYFDDSTGAFQGDLRLYRVSPPQSVWVGISDQDVTIGLSYVGASVADGGEIKKQEKSGSTQTVKRQEPNLLHSLNFVGQLNATYLNTPMNLTQLVTLLAPNVTLTAIDPKQSISTTLTSKEASFVNGVFAGSPVGAASRPTPFELPGRRLEIFPVGLIIASVWATVGVGIMAWGTFGRYQFRQQYRRRKMRGRVAGPKF